MIDRKRQIILIISTIITVIVALSLSYAFFYYEKDGNLITLETGSISINFAEGNNYLALHDTYPKSDMMGKIDPHYYDFTVTGSADGNDDIYYEIQIEQLSGNTLSEEYVNVYLTNQDDDGIENVVMSISDLANSEHNGNKVIYSDYIYTTNQTTDFRLRFWIDETYTDNIQNTFNFKVVLYAINDKKTLTAAETIKSLVGTNGLVAVNTDGDLAEEGDIIREYRYSGNAKHCTYTIDGKTYSLNVETDTCPKACYIEDDVLFRSDSDDFVSADYTCADLDETEYTPKQTEPLDGEVKNYIWYNDEMWRIIGLFGETLSNGTVRQLVRIRKNEPLLKQDVPEFYTYNNVTMKIKDTYEDLALMKHAYVTWNSDKYFGQRNYNNWTTSSLQYYLNDETKGTGSYYNSILPKYQEMIETIQYALGNVNYDIATPKISYNEERSSNVWSGNEETWTGKIGMVYPSDYGYASSSENWDTNMYDYGFISNTGAFNNWMNASVRAYEWFLNPSAGRDRYATGVYATGVVVDGYLHPCSVYTCSSAVSPVLTLKSSVVITGGDGSKESPYTLS